jgi:hypothetical protein
MTASSKHVARIQLRLRELAQLFNSMDPSPFYDRDLDDDAEEFILNWAREHPKDHEFELTVHLATMPPPDRAAGLEEAVRHYFASRHLVKCQQYKQDAKRGHFSLIVGLLFLAVCLSVAKIVMKLRHEPTPEIFTESLTIVGWVALWRPLEFYLYDWWPMRDERHLLERLSRMRVKLVLPAT